MENLFDTLIKYSELDCKILYNEEDYFQNMKNKYLREQKQGYDNFYYLPIQSTAAPTSTSRKYIGLNVIIGADIIDEYMKTPLYVIGIDTCVKRIGKTDFEINEKNFNKFGITIKKHEHKNSVSFDFKIKGVEEILDHSLSLVLFHS